MNRAEPVLVRPMIDLPLEMLGRAGHNVVLIESARLSRRLGTSGFGWRRHQAKRSDRREYRTRNQKPTDHNLSLFWSGGVTPPFGICYL